MLRGGESSCRHLGSGWWDCIRVSIIHQSKTFAPHASTQAQLAMFSHKTNFGTLQTLVINSYPVVQTSFKSTPTKRKERSLTLWLQMMRHQYSNSTDGGTLIFGHTSDPKMKFEQMQKSDQSYITKESKEVRKNKNSHFSFSFFISFFQKESCIISCSFLTLTLEKKTK